MNDFLIHFAADADGRRLAALLRERPPVSAHRVLTYDFPWGVVAVQPPAARGYEPLYERNEQSLTVSVGRPRFMGVEHEQRGDHGFNRMLRDTLRTHGAAETFGSLTGMFAALQCDRSGVRVITDLMAFLPVYAGTDARGRIVAVGTHAESVAELAGRGIDFDPVSLGDLLVNQYVTFPYTTRRGVNQLAPAALTEFEARRGGETRQAGVRTSIFWEPREPSASDTPPAAELEAELEATLRSAAADISRGAGRIALTLSGGLDSRLVLASLMGKRLGDAITYATRENRELEVARRVAAAAGLRHHIAWRGEEFYAELMPRAVALLGTELRGECHGFSIVDNNLDAAFDLIVGGFLSDTLFKGHYLSPAMREQLRRRSPYYRARRAVSGAARAVGLLPPERQKTHYWDVARGMSSRLRADVREALAERHRVRLEQVRRIRPESADEWVRFWPGSRCDGGYGPQANHRLFTSDELFMHRRLVELAARVPLHEKLNGRLTRRVFPRLYGDLGRIENSSTGLPAASRSDGHTAGTRNGSRPTAPAAPSRFPWNDVHHSWVDYELLQKLSPTWSGYRDALAHSRAVDVMDSVLDGGIREFVREYREEAGFLFNRTAIQATYAIDRALRRPRAAPPAPVTEAPSDAGADARETDLVRS